MYFPKSFVHRYWSVLKHQLSRYDFLLSRYKILPKPLKVEPGWFGEKSLHIPCTVPTNPKIITAHSPMFTCALCRGGGGWWGRPLTVAYCISIATDFPAPMSDVHFHEDMHGSRESNIYAVLLHSCGLWQAFVCDWKPSAFIFKVTAGLNVQLSCFSNFRNKSVPVLIFNSRHVNSS